MTTRGRRCRLGRAWLVAIWLCAGSKRAGKCLKMESRCYPSEAALRVELSRVYARLGKPDLAAEQTKSYEKLRSVQQ